MERYERTHTAAYATTLTSLYDILGNFYSSGNCFALFSFHALGFRIFAKSSFFPTLMIDIFTFELESIAWGSVILKQIWCMKIPLASIVGLSF